MSLVWSGPHSDRARALTRVAPPVSVPVFVYVACSSLNILQFDSIAHSSIRLGTINYSTPNEFTVMHAELCAGERVTVYVCPFQTETKQTVKAILIGTIVANICVMRPELQKCTGTRHAHTQVPLHVN